MTFLLWGFYLAGWLGIIIKRAYQSAKNPLTPWTNIPEYFALWAPGILVNFLITTALFVGVWRDTAFLSKTLLMFGVHKDIQVPLNPLTAVLYGVSSDQIADVFIGVISGISGKIKGMTGGGGN